MKLLIASDDMGSAGDLKNILEKNNYAAYAVYTGKDTFEQLSSWHYDGMILDISSMEKNVPEIIKRIREEGFMIPVMVLGADNSAESIVSALDAGAGDHIAKPFDEKILLARIRVMTRSRNHEGTKLSFGNITLDCSTFTLSSPDGNILLANKEFQLMEILLSAPKELVSTEKLMERIWGFESESDINVVWVHISTLRKKLSGLNADIRIKTTRNSGYSLEKRNSGE